MRRAAIPLLIYGAFIAGNATMLWIWGEDAVNVGAFYFAVIVTWLVALGFAAAHWKQPDGEALRERPDLTRRALPDLSFGAGITGIAIVTMVYGARFGLFLVWIGGGLLLLGFARLAAELGSQRRDSRRHVEEGRARAGIDAEDVPP
ncbi:MAG: hypothetical protein IRZ21_10865 [Thermoleophilaceae bacterium]|nr:hypothetical protein [Thermoleophilaceae bacterium]